MPGGGGPRRSSGAPLASADNNRRGNVPGPRHHVVHGGKAPQYTAAGKQDQPAYAQAEPQGSHHEAKEDARRRQPPGLPRWSLRSTVSLLDEEARPSGLVGAHHVAG